MKKIAGFTLIEMLCAMAISMIMIGMIVEVFLGYKSSFKVNQALSEVRENARFASHILTTEISQAGYIGCPKLSENLPIVNLGSGSQLYYFNALGVYDESDWQSHLPSSFHLKPKPESHIIVVRKMSSQSGDLLEEAEKTKLVRVSLEPRFNEGDDVAISDCKHIVISNVQKVYRSEVNHYQQLTLSGELENKFSVGAQIGELTTQVFAIQETSRKNFHGEKIYALYEFDRNGKKMELVSGVFDMNVVCFEKRPSGSIIEVKPNEVLNWAEVNMLKISLLFGSQENVLAQPKIYYFNLKKYLPTDKRLYRAITFYIPIRG